VAEDGGEEGEEGGGGKVHLDRLRDVHGRNMKVRTLVRRHANFIGPFGVLP
jgi:hypothetical protein